MLWCIWLHLRYCSCIITVVPGQSVALISFKLVLLSKLCNLGNIHPIFSFLLCKVYYKCSIGQHQHHIWAGGGRHGVWDWRSSQGWWAALLLHGPGLCGCLYPISWVCEWIAPLEALVSGPGSIVCVWGVWVCVYCVHLWVSPCWASVRVFICVHEDGHVCLCLCVPVFLCLRVRLGLSIQLF